MPDIGLVWNATYADGDWAGASDLPVGNDDGTLGDLSASVLVSLFSDRLAPADATIPDGTANRRGCWTDAYEDQPIGSLLWLLMRSKRTGAVLLRARDMCKDALAWMVTDQVASRVDVQTFWAGREAMGITVTIARVSAPGAVIGVTVPWANA